MHMREKLALDRRQETGVRRIMFFYVSLGATLDRPNAYLCVVLGRQLAEFDANH
jgi:hypothetical protein